MVLGTLLILASAVGFAGRAVAGSYAYAEGTTLGLLLAARFVLAAALFWLVVAGWAPYRRELRDLPARPVAIGLLLGAVGYSVQAGTYFAALELLDASLLTLLNYTFPTMVAVLAVALGRERMTRRRVVALGLSSTGLVLVLATAGAGALDPLGVLLALASAATYSLYILASEAVSARVSPVVLSTLVCTGAGVVLTAVAALTGHLTLAAVTWRGWAWLGGLAGVSTVLAIVLFFAGMRRVGSTNASIMSTLEPVVTVGLAVALFGEQLSGWQVVGGTLVVCTVLVLHLRLPGRAHRRRHTRGGTPASSSSGVKKRSDSAVSV